MGLNQCKQICGRQNFVDVWPAVTGRSQPNAMVSILKIDINRINFGAVNISSPNNFWTDNRERFYKQMAAKVANRTDLSTDDAAEVLIEFYIRSNNVQFNMKVDETYQLTTQVINSTFVRVSIISETIFGARHGLETLVQLFAYDDMRNAVFVSNFTHFLAKLIHNGIPFFFR